MRTHLVASLAIVPVRPGKADVHEPGPVAFPPFATERRARATFVAGLLRSGCAVHDETFDAIYPLPVRMASGVHWTPVGVCARIVRLLRLRPEDRVLDIGAGAGKFCIVAAAMSGARVRGVEREPTLADVAREAARRYDTDIEIEAAAFDPRACEDVDVVYLFNPFAETLLLPGVVDFAADRGAARMAEDIAAVEELLARAPRGLRVATFCGFGGLIPDDYRRLAKENWDGGQLEVWDKR